MMVVTVSLPQSVIDIARECAAAHGADIAEATRLAEQRIRALPDFEQIVNTLITAAVRDMVYDARHATNARFKREAGYYGRRGRVDTAASEVVNRAAKSVYAYCIAGTMLGELQGKDLPDLAEKEELTAKGYTFNAVLLRELAQKVKGEQKVRDVIPENRLKARFDHLYRQVFGTGAA